MFKNVNNDGTILLKKKSFDDINKIDINDYPDSYIVTYIDTETTGFVTDQDEIIELSLIQCAYDIRTNKLFGWFNIYQSFNQPTEPISEKITNITHITNEMVHNHFIDIEFVKNILLNSTYIIAHNASFDRKFISRYGMDSYNNIWLCSDKMIKWNEKYKFSSSKLELLCHWHNFYVDSHRAMNDIVAMILLLNYYGNYYVDLLKFLNQQHYEFSINVPYDFSGILRNNGYKYDYETKSMKKKITESEYDKEMTFVNNLAEKMKKYYSAKYSNYYPKDDIISGMLSIKNIELCELI